MSAFRIDFKHRDLVKMYKTLDKVGASPKKALNKGVSKAASITKRSVKELAPVGRGPTQGTLKRNIIIKTERSQLTGKKVREVTFKGGAEANAQLQKPIKKPGVLGGTSKKAYYPASQEYGFLVRIPGGEKYVAFKRLKGSNQYVTKIGLVSRYPSRKVEGKYFMRDAAESASEPAKEAMIETMTKELDKIWTET